MAWPNDIYGNVMDKHVWISMEQYGQLGPSIANYSQIDQLWLRMVNYVLEWHNIAKYSPIWSSMTQYGYVQMWPNT